MNIELLNEIKQSLQDGKNLSDIASELAMQKNSISLILRMDKILTNEYSSKFQKYCDDIESLESVKDTLISINESLKNDIDKLILENETLKHPSIKIPFNLSIFQNTDELENLKEEINFLKSELEDYEIFLNNIPMFIQKLFNRR